MPENVVKVKLSDKLKKLVRLLDYPWPLAQGIGIRLARSVARSAFFGTFREIVTGVRLGLKRPIPSAALR